MLQINKMQNAALFFFEETYRLHQYILAKNMSEHE